MLMNPQESMPEVQSEGSLKPAMLGIDQLVLVRYDENPRAVAIAERIRKELSADITDIAIENSQPTSAGYKPLLEHYSLPDGKKVMYAAVGGDGVHSHFGNAAYSSRVTDPIAFLAGGYANDGSHMLFSHRAVVDPVRAIQTAHVAPHRLIDIVADHQPSGLDSVKRGLFYVGGRVSGVLGKVIDSHEHRLRRQGKGAIGRLLTDAAAIREHLPHIPELTIVENGMERRRSELLYVKGRRMAKYLRFGGQTLLDDDAARLELRHSRYSSVAATAIKAWAGLSMHRFGRDESHNFSIETDDGAPIEFQLDGDEKTYKSGTEFWVKLSDRQIKVLTDHRAA